MNTPLDDKIKAFEDKLKPSQIATESTNDPASSNAAKTGTLFLIAVVFFGYIGYAVDQQFNSSPAGILIGGFIGLATGIYNAWREINKAPPSTP